MRWRGISVTAVSVESGRPITSRRVAVPATMAPAASARLRACARTMRSVSEVERDTRDDGVGFEEERTFDQQRPLIMEQMVPPARGNEFRQDNRDVAVRTLGRDLLDILEQRLH